MMFRNKLETLMKIFCCIFVLVCVCGLSVSAEETEELPTGDILIMYSDHASEDDLAQVMTLVSELTYQSFQVTYAPASACVGQLDRFSFIICDKIEYFPTELIQELYAREKKGNQIWNARKEVKNSSGENDVRIMFIGSGFLRSYLQQTDREGMHLDFSSQVGKVQYSFDTATSKEVLAKEKDFLFLTGDKDYQSGSITVGDYQGYFCAKKGALYHIPVTDISNNVMKAALSKEISLWKWPYNGEPHIYAQYMVINKVYPYQNPDKLLEIVNYMIERKEPFVISVMPVYINGNYPAMQHFCEVLRYAQANGGVIILHAPINQMPQFDEELINEYITTAVKIYMEQGVYPMGLQAPENWLYNSETVDVISRFRTILIDETIDSQIQMDETNTNQVYKDGHQWIAPAIKLDTEGASYLKTYSTAVTFDMTEDMQKIERKVQACITSEVPLKSLWDVEHSFWTDEDLMSYRNHIILINGERTENSFTATEYEENFQYKRNMLQRFSADLASENQKLIAIVIVVSVIFTCFLLLARYKNRQRFLVHNHSKFDTFESSQTKTDEKRNDEMEYLININDFDIETHEDDDYDLKEIQDNYDI